MWDSFGGKCNEKITIRIHILNDKFSSGNFKASAANALLFCFCFVIQTLSTPKNMQKLSIYIVG